MKRRNKPAGPDRMAQPRQANENPTAAVQPSAAGFSDKSVRLTENTSGSG